ncbi:ROK family protein [Pseudomonas syringae]|uniref:ROK family protein n=1 Tax=Pseudomonas syringae TaxID=317 RepID=UPI003F8435E0
MGPWLCIDLGFTFTRFAVWQESGFSVVKKIRTIDTRREFSTDAIARREAWLSWLKATVSELLDETSGICKIAMCFPGVVSSHGVIWRSNSIWGNANTDTSPEELAGVLGLPVIVLNDLSASAIRYGEDPSFENVDSVAVVSISSGIGAKLYDRLARRVILEPKGRNGELGLAIVETGEKALTNDNGNLRGILGNYSSGVGFTRIIERAIKEGDQLDFEKSMLRTKIKESDLQLEPLDRVKLNKLAVDCILAGDTFTKRALTDSVRYLTQVLHIVMLFNAPGRIVITGGFANSLGEIYRLEVVQSMATHLKLLYEIEEIDEIIKLGYADDMDNLFGLAAWLRKIEVCP